MKIGLIGRADLTGLGNQSQDWFKNLPIEKVLVVWGDIPSSPYDIYGDKAVVCENGAPSIEELKEFVKDIDVLLAIETPYNWNAFKIAKEAGVKTILAPNYEFFPHTIPEEPDLYLCYSLLNYDYVPDPKVYLPQPISTDVFPYQKREKANTFLFNNGNGGVHERNSINEFIQAIPLIKSDIKIIINSQRPIQNVPDSRVKVNIGDQSLKEIWREGDVFIHIRKFGANSLPINEAMSQGMPVVAIDRKPENEYLPKEFLIEPDGEIPLQIRPDLITIKSKILSPIKIAEKIDEIANTDIGKYSEQMKKISDKLSWNNQRDNWIKELKK